MNGRPGTRTSSGSSPVICRNDALRRAALVVLAGRVQEPRPPAEGDRPLGAAGQRRAGRRAGQRRARGRGRPSPPGSRRRRAGASSASTAPASESTPSSRPGRAAHLDAAVGDLRPARAPGCASSRPRAAFLALSTLGWSNGLMPSRRPATAVAVSQTRNCAPSGPVTVSPRLADAGRRRLPRRRAAPRRRRRDAGQRTSGASGPRPRPGRMPVPCLPVRLGDQLLGPVAEADDAGAVVGDGELVAARRCRAERGAEHERRVVRRSSASSCR